MPPQAVGNESYENHLRAKHFREVKILAVSASNSLISSSLSWGYACAYEKKREAEKKNQPLQQSNSSH